MDRLEAEAQLDRELDESTSFVKRKRNRVVYALPVAIITGALGGTLGYLITTFVTDSHGAHVWSYAASAIGILLVAWGMTGISRVHATAGDRAIDVIVCVLVGALVLGIVQPTPLWHLFESRGLGNVPRFHELFAWSAAWACACVALSSLVRHGLQR